jgi:enoyl-CoA hydratase/carnithine racemase
MQEFNEDMETAVLTEGRGGEAVSVATASPKMIFANGLKWPGDTFQPYWLEPLDALVVTKSLPGFDKASVDTLAALVGAIARGDFAGLKYLVLDFAHRGGAGKTESAMGFEDLVAAHAELILDAPIITIAWARSFMIGADLDFALHCSVLAAQRGARFSFDGDPMALFGVYAALARKIGFVKTERLIENGEILEADDMRDLLVAKDVVEAEAGMAPIERYLRQSARRFNSSQAIFRAQRMATPALDRRAGPTPRR